MVKPPSLLKTQKISRVWWWAPVIPATQEAETGELFEPGRQRLQWAKITPLPSSQGDRARLHFKNPSKRMGAVAHTYSPSYSGGWGRRIAWTWRLQWAEIEPLHSIVTRLHLKKKKRSDTVGVCSGSFICTGFLQKICKPRYVVFFKTLFTVLIFLRKSLLQGCLAYFLYHRLSLLQLEMYHRYTFSVGKVKLADANLGNTWRRLQVKPDGGLPIISISWGQGCDCLIFFYFCYVLFETGSYCVI